MRKSTTIYITLKEACERLGLNYEFVQKIARTGKLAEYGVVTPVAYQREDGRAKSGSSCSYMIKECDIERLMGVS